MARLLTFVLALAVLAVSMVAALTTDASAVGTAPRMSRRAKGPKGGKGGKGSTTPEEPALEEEPPQILLSLRGWRSHSYSGDGGALATSPHGFVVAPARCGGRSPGVGRAGECDGADAVGFRDTKIGASRRGSTRNS